VTGPADIGPNAAAADAAVVEAVLLDIDGTLLDSNDAHAQAWSDVFNEAGFQIGSETVLSLIGMGSDKLVPRLTGLTPESVQGNQLIARRKEIFAREYLPSVRPFPHAWELLDRLRADRLRLVVATSAGDDELRALLHALSAEWLLDDASSSSDAKRSKPDPDIVRVAVDKAGVGPDRCVMIGDTPYDVEAATKARVRIIAVRCGGWGDEDLRGATEIHDDPASLLARYDESVIGRGVRASPRRIEREGIEAEGRSAQRSGEEGSHASES
jgi:phosphoglycolate phosphatase-like HAD superfamily hydrolase